MQDGSDYVLNGSKIFITNAPVADLFVLYATLDRQLGAAGICAFIVEKGTPGVRVGKKKDRLDCAQHSWPNSCLRVPRARNSFARAGRSRG
jgi:alkylation response protein AidB-like acyl-CoA dehydrogenase